MHVIKSLFVKSKCIYCYYSTVMNHTVMSPVLPHVTRSATTPVSPSIEWNASVVPHSGYYIIKRNKILASYIILCGLKHGQCCPSDIYLYNRHYLLCLICEKKSFVLSEVVSKTDQQNPDLEKDACGHACFLFWILDCLKRCKPCVLWPIKIDCVNRSISACPSCGQTMSVN